MNQTFYHLPNEAISPETLIIPSETFNVVEATDNGKMGGAEGIKIIVEGTNNTGTHKAVIKIPDLAKPGVADIDPLAEISVLSVLQQEHFNACPRILEAVIPNDQLIQSKDRNTNQTKKVDASTFFSQQPQHKLPKTKNGTYYAIEWVDETTYNYPSKTLLPILLKRNNTTTPSPEDCVLSFDLLSKIADANAQALEHGIALSDKKIDDYRIGTNGIKIIDWGVINRCRSKASPKMEQAFALYEPGKVGKELTVNEAEQSVNKLTMVLLTDLLSLPVPGNLYESPKLTAIFKKAPAAFRLLYYAQFLENSQVAELALDPNIDRGVFNFASLPPLGLASYLRACTEIYTNENITPEYIQEHYSDIANLPWNQIILSMRLQLNGDTSLTGMEEILKRKFEERWKRPISPVISILDPQTSLPLGTFPPILKEEQQLDTNGTNIENPTPIPVTPVVTILDSKLVELENTEPVTETTTPPEISDIKPTYPPSLGLSDRYQRLYYSGASMENIRAPEIDIENYIKEVMGQLDPVHAHEFNSIIEFAAQNKKTEGFFFQEYEAKAPKMIEDLKAIILDEQNPNAKTIAQLLLIMISSEYEYNIKYGPFATDSVRLKYIGMPFLYDITIAVTEGPQMPWVKKRAIDYLAQLANPKAPLPFSGEKENSRYTQMREIYKNLEYTESREKIITEYTRILHEAGIDVDITDIPLPTPE